MLVDVPRALLAALLTAALLPGALPPAQALNSSLSSLASAHRITVDVPGHGPYALHEDVVAFDQHVAGLGSPTDPAEGMPGPMWTCRDAVFWFPG